MNFNSFDFFAFLVLFVGAVFVVPKRFRSILYTLSGFLFYSFWSIKFTSLLLITSVADYFLAIQIEKHESDTVRRRFLTASIVLNLGVLGFFKYCNFFVENVYALSQMLGWNIPLISFQIVLPVGISFYTFQEMSYTIDVYRRHCRARTDYFDVAAFISFFPQLVAGPIERAHHLMDQLESPRQATAEEWAVGTEMVLWGLFEKVVIADNVANLANYAFDAPAGVRDTGLALVGVYAFAVQIYCDFAGYTDIARGVAKWFGIDIMRNFNRPYVAVSMGDFWARWHISLSTWLKDYLYIPLGGNRGTPSRVTINLLLTMFLGGLWHGATWMFVFWGVYHGGLLALEHRFLPRRKEYHPRTVFHHFGRSFLIFQLVCFGWVLFRAANLEVFSHWVRMFISFRFDPQYLPLWGSLLIYSLPLAVLWGVQSRHGVSDRLAAGWPAFARVAFIGVLLAGLVVFSAEAGREFIYFQF